MSKLYYSISEVADMLEVNPSLLRFWEKEFAQFINPHKNVKGTRFYKEEDIDKLKQIYFLVKTQGLTLAGARKKLKEHKGAVTSTHEIYKRLSAIKEELLSIRKGLTLPSDEPELV